MNIQNEIEKLKTRISELEEILKEDTDKIYLLSIEEYLEYGDKIPKCSWWWLRSPSHDDKYTAGVRLDSSVSGVGLHVDYEHVAIRPALNYSNLDSKIIKSAIYEDRFIFNEFPFRIIDEDEKIAIAEVPIAFDMFDENSNDYKNSYVRKKLLEWFETGVW